MKILLNQKQSCLFIILLQLNVREKHKFSKYNEANRVSFNLISVRNFGGCAG